MNITYLKSGVAEVELSYKTTVKPSQRYKITNSKNFCDLIRCFFDENMIDHYEQMLLILLNKGNHVIGYRILSTGGVSGTVVDPKLIFQYALKANASAILMAHNHPSGALIVSDADKRITDKIKSAGAMLEIPLLDHMIITSEDYLSMADTGLI